MNRETQDALSKDFGREAIRQKKGQGGRTMDYVSHGMVTKRLNDVAPDWSVEMVERWITETNGALHCVGGVMRMTIGGVTREEAGGPTRLTTLADDLKNTYSDCLKRCAMRFGVALSLWESAEENDEDAQADDAPPGPSQALTEAQDKALAEVRDSAEAGVGYNATKEILRPVRAAATEEQKEIIDREWFAIRRKFYPDTIKKEG